MRLLTIALLASVALAACGDGTGPGDATRSNGPPGSSPSGSPTVPTEDPSVSPSTGKATVRQLKGTVTEGVESGCLLLTAPDGLYLLVGGDRAGLPPGAQVVVTGEVKRDLVTTCQQGIPFLVRSVRPA